MMKIFIVIFEVITPCNLLDVWQKLHEASISIFISPKQETSSFTQKRKQNKTQHCSFYNIYLFSNNNRKEKPYRKTQQVLLNFFLLCIIYQRFFFCQCNFKIITLNIFLCNIIEIIHKRRSIGQKLELYRGVKVSFIYSYNVT